MLQSTILKKCCFLSTILLVLCVSGCTKPQGGKVTPTTPNALLTPAVPTDVGSPTGAATPTVTDTPQSTPTATPTLSPSPTPTGTTGEVCFSEADYFLNGDTAVTLTITRRKSGFITYTMNGDEPLETSTLYEEPLLLTAAEGSEPMVYSIRAKAWYDDGSSSKTYVHTYFVGTEVANRYTTYVFSINGDPEVLTDGPDGILYGENYKLRGDSSERPVHIAALSPDGTPLFSQFSGVRVYGGTSREHAIKSLKLYARKRYEDGKGTFSFSEFLTPTADGQGIVEKYDKLVLRNGGDDFQLSFVRDELLQRIAIKAGFANYEAVLPAIAYINGNYYGMYWLHESYCDKYFQNRSGKGDGEYVVLEGSDTRKSLGDDAVETASAKEYNALYNKFSMLDLTDDSNYLALCEKIDVWDYINYMSYNMYSANYDWPQGNFRCYRYYPAEGEAYGTGDKDGRFRYLLHDMDIGFGTYQSTADAGAIRNDLKQVLTPSEKRYSPLLAALLKREDVRDYFIDRMLFYMSGPLSYETVDEVLTSMCAERDAELTIFIAHLQTLKDTEEIYAGKKSTDRHLARIRSFAKQRPDYMKQYLEDFFDIDLAEYQAAKEL